MKLTKLAVLLTLVSIGAAAQPPAPPPLENSTLQNAREFERQKNATADQRANSDRVEHSTGRNQPLHHVIPILYSMFGTAIQSQMGFRDQMLFAAAGPDASGGAPGNEAQLLDICRFVLRMDVANANAEEIRSIGARLEANEKQQQRHLEQTFSSMLDNLSPEGRDIVQERLTYILDHSASVDIDHERTATAFSQDWLENTQQSCNAR